MTTYDENTHKETAVIATFKTIAEFGGPILFMNQHILC
jgi:hypothetical protein